MLKRSIGALFLVLALLAIAHSQQQTQNHPRQEQHKAEDTHASTPEKRPLVVEIECDPACIAKEPKNQTEIILARLIRKTVDDPLALFTAALALVTGLMALLVLLQLRDAKHASRRQLRAYVGVHEIETKLPNLFELSYEIPDDGNFPPNFIREDFVTLTIKNYGQTPARNVLSVVNWRPVVPFGAGLPNNFGYHDLASYDAVAKSGRSTIDRGNTHFTTINLNKLRAFRDANDKKTSLYLYGHIDYTDIYDRRWRRQFCYVWNPWRPSGNRFIPQGNRESEYQIHVNDPGIYPAP